MAAGSARRITAPASAFRFGAPVAAAPPRQALSNEARVEDGPPPPLAARGRRGAALTSRESSAWAAARHNAGKLAGPTRRKVMARREASPRHAAAECDWTQGTG